LIKSFKITRPNFLGLKKPLARVKMMKKIVMLCSTVALIAMFAIMMTGCESADGYSIEVNASSYSVNDGGQVYLSASGWDDYAWSVSDNKIGFLNKLNGPSVIYTSRAASGVQTITVTARGSGATVSTSTNKAETVTPLVRTIEIVHGTGASQKNTSTTTSSANEDKDPPTP
jgi:hypothetical protein